MTPIRAFILYLMAVAACGANICSPRDTGLMGNNLAVTCYAGNFLTKMLDELNGGHLKTAEHVRVHLLPYLGGMKTLKALKSDSPDNPECTVCYTNHETATSLINLRNTLSADQLKDFDSLNVCYARLTEAIMAYLPKSPDGVYLRPLQKISSFKQVLVMVR
ncbi:hypothetical protein AAMO2058_000062000 [Amorphochlora amoebiformis]